MKHLPFILSLLFFSVYGITLYYTIKEFQHVYMLIDYMNREMMDLTSIITNL